MPNDLGTQTNVFRIRAALSARPLGRGAIVSVIVQNPLNNADGTPNAINVLVGDGAAQAILLLPGQATPELFTADLKDVYVRSATGSALDTDVTVIARRYPAPVRNVYDRSTIRR